MIDVAVTRAHPGVLAKIERRLVFASVIALTRTGQQVRQGLRDHLETAVDRPTPWTIRGVQMTPARPGAPYVEVYTAQGLGRSRGPGKYLPPLERGGQRHHKAFEKSLIAAGIMKGDEYAYPAKGYPLDGYGNIPGRTVVQILSQLQAFGEGGYRANATAATLRRRARKGLGRYFVPQADSYLPRGVYERWGREAIRAVMLFAYSATYKPDLRFVERGYEIARTAYPVEFKRAYSDAVGRLT